MLNKSYYSSLDIMKFVMALLIMLSHTQSEWALDGSSLLHYFLAISNFGVPFFFACSGFLFFSKIKKLEDKEQEMYYRRWSLRVGKMYLAWSLIYFSFILFRWVTEGTTVFAVMAYIHKSIVVSTYPTIWFLPALWLGVSIAYFLYKRTSIANIAILAAFLYLICSLGDSYSNVICQNAFVHKIWSWYMEWFLSFRTALFNGFPFVVVGLLLCHKSNNDSVTRPDSLLFALFAFLYVVESVIIKTQHLSDYTHSGYMLLPATYFIMKCLIKMQIAPRPIFLELRNLSMIIFLSQRIFLTAIPSVSTLYRLWIESLDPYSTILILDGFILTFSLVMSFLSKRLTFLKILF